MSKKIQNTLKKLIDTYSVPIEKIALEAGVTSTTVYRWKTGERSPAFLVEKFLEDYLKKVERKINQRKKGS